MISGILAIDKPLGWTSHDVVARIRRVSGQRQVGHAGTLDPLATGLLLVVLGKATRLSSYLMSGTKEYCVHIVLGVTTATDDSEGEVKRQSGVLGISRLQLEQSLNNFLGTIQQHPPQFSAVRQDGQRLYSMARRGAAVETKARTVTILGITLEKFAPPALWLRIGCESGTYIRSLARDIGEDLGVGAYVHALRRLSSGRFSVANSVSLDRLNGSEDVRERLLPPDHALLDQPAVVLGIQQVGAIQTGQSIPFEALPHTVSEPVMPESDEVRMYHPSGRLVALGRRSEGLIQPFRVFEEARR